MPRICYTPKKFKPDSLIMIQKANEIINEYSALGFDLTLRQLYYQFVARDLIPNTPASYKNLGNLINDARLAGLIDWNKITDRTRNLHELSSWDGPASIVDACAKQFRLDLWSKQTYRPEVWIEKEALAGVFQRVCDELRVPMFACRGYTSQSEMWVAGMRLKAHINRGQTPMILHFGDHDPSGIDMTRDITDRLELFMEGELKLDRLALNMDQIEQYSPPPNPAKITDSRAEAYIRRFGTESWELDALDPTTLGGLVRDSILEIRDQEAWDEMLLEEGKAQGQLHKVSDNWDKVVKRLG